MTNTHTLNQRQSKKVQTWAVISGISLVLMALVAGFAYGYAHSSLVVAGDGFTTLNNIIGRQSLFMAEILAWMAIVVLDLLVSYGFYVFLKPAAPKLAKQAGILRLIYTGLLALAVVHLLFAHNLAFGNQPAPAMVLSRIESFEYIWSLGLIIFGMHLLFAGLAAYKTHLIPKLWSFMLVIAGLSYIVLHTFDTFLPELVQVIATLQTILVIPMTLGELGFAVWLLVKGRKVAYS